MKQLLKLAWKNIWRKKRRSFIAIGSVAFAIVITISMRSLQLGSYDKMIEAAVKNSGHIQVHRAGYWADKSIDDSMEESPDIEAKIRAIDGVSTLIPRLVNFALAAGADNAKAAQVLGIDPASEDNFNRLSGRLSAGHYLQKNSTGVLIASSLADYLKLKTGDTLVLVGQGYRASIAAGKYPVEGILELPNPQANRMAVYLPLRQAQIFNAAPSEVSAYLLTVGDAAKTKSIAAQLRRRLGVEYEVLDWEEMTPEIGNNIKIDTTIFTLIASALYIIAGFGIFGTVVMMVLERKNEFGVLQANGLLKSQIQTLILLETLLLGLLGVVLAFVVEIPFVNFMHAHPIPLMGESARSFEAMGAEPVLQMGVKPWLFASIGGIVFVLMLLSAVFPALMIGRMKLSENLKIA